MACPTRSDLAGAPYYLPIPSVLVKREMYFVRSRRVWSHRLLGFVLKRCQGPCFVACLRPASLSPPSPGVLLVASPQAWLAWNNTTWRTIYRTQARAALLPLRPRTRTGRNTK